MPDARDWPDPANPDDPQNPHQAGPHRIADQCGKRRWAAWMPSDGGRTGSWMYAVGDEEMIALLDQATKTLREG